MRDILHRTVDLPCPVEETWDIVLDPSWLGDDGEVNATEGGEGWVREGDETRWMLVEEIVEGERFTYRWASFADEPSRVEITLSPIAEGTRVDIVESPIPATMKASLALR
jgi:Activator of Hsp90 ATPase homolog 1-like protein